MIQENADMVSNAELLKAIAHPARLCILTGLIEKGGATVTEMQNCLECPQSTLSQHIAKLKAYNIIKGKRNGREITYSVTNEKVMEIIKIFTQKTGGKLTNV
jgi:predicted transcriptional regulator